MKKIITTLACLLMATTISFAAEKSDSKFGAGVKATFNYGMMYGFEEQDDEVDRVPQGIGFDAGIIFKVKLANAAYFAPEINFAYMGTSHKFRKTERSYTSMDLDIPFLFRGVFLDKFYVSAGPQIVLNLNSDSDIPLASGNSMSSSIINQNAEKYGFNESTQQAFFTAGLAAGIGYNVLGNLNVDFRFYMGLMELFPDVMNGVEAMQNMLSGNSKKNEHWSQVDFTGAKMMKFKVGISYWFM